MNRLFFAAVIASIAGMSPVFAQSSGTFPSSSIAQNFQFINHPPALPVPASSAAPAGGMRGHRHRQSSTGSDSTGAASAQQ